MNTRFALLALWAALLLAAPATAQDCTSASDIVVDASEEMSSGYTLAGPYSSIGNYNVGQTITAPCSGDLVAFTLTIAFPVEQPITGTVRVYEGAGTGGDVLSEAPYTFGPSGNQTATFPAVPVASGSVYTVFFYAGTGWAAIQRSGLDVYSGGGVLLDNPFGTSSAENDIDFVADFEPGGSGGPAVDLTLASVTAERGGTLTVSATLVNTTDASLRVRAFVTVTMPNGRVYSQRGRSANIPAGAAIGPVAVIRPVPVPAGAPDGVYTVTVSLVDVSSGDELDVETTTFTLGTPPPGMTSPTEGRYALTDGGVVTALRAATVEAATPDLATPEAEKLTATAPHVSPNPFGEAAEITYALAETAEVDLRVFDTLGREVAVLVSGRQSAGAQSATLLAGDLPSGVYVWRLTIGGEMTTGRVTLAR